MAGDRGAAGGAGRAGGEAACGVRAGQEEILRAVLAGVELGEWDRRIVAWMAGWDTCTVLTVASWIGRAREAGPRG